MARRTTPPEYVVPFWQVIFAILIVAAAIWIYRPAIDGDWLWDDDTLVTKNATLRNLHGLGEIWFTTPTFDYWPLTWTLLWVEWHLWGDNSLGYHVVNLTLHIASAFLVWRLLGRLGLRGGWVGGLLFAIHPLAVESVAWISEVKNTLSLPFYLLALDAWLDHEEGKPSGYARSILFFLLAMLAKTSTIMLPAVLLLYCWWKRGRVAGPDLRRMLPFAIIAIVLGLTTLVLQSHIHDESPAPMGGVITRLIRAGTELIFYLGKFVLPINLLPIYARWVFDRPTVWQMLSIPALFVMLVLFWTQRKSWGRHALLGFGFFALNLLPVLGFVKMKYMSVSWVADHFAYLPLIGLIGLFVACIDAIEARLPLTLRPIGNGVLALLMVALACKAHWYVSAFTGPETLWTYEVEQLPDGWFGHNELGKILLQAALPGPAREHFEKVVELNPNAGEPRDNLGVALTSLGRMPEALAAFREALRLDPDFPDTHNNFGILLARTGHTDEAIEQFRQALQARPDYIDAHMNLGHAYFLRNEFPEAIRELQISIAIDPLSFPAHLNLAFALQRAGLYPEAVEQFNRALAINPESQIAQRNLYMLQHGTPLK